MLNLFFSRLIGVLAAPVPFIVGIHSSVLLGGGGGGEVGGGGEYEMSDECVQVFIDEVSCGLC